MWLSARHKLPDTVLPVLPANRLLQDKSRLALIRKIKTLSQATKEHYQRLYHQPLITYAEWVQQLPASESYHHAWPGGMLTHILEVIVHALGIRSGQMLPHGADAEKVAKEKDVWTYAVFSAALLHDIGKPLVDQEIQLFDKKRRPIGCWNAWDKPMSSQASWYEVRFRRDREYALHEKISLFMASKILPADGIHWLSCHPTVFREWVASLSGEESLLDAMIKRADQVSTAQAMGAGQAHAAKGTNKPLQGRLVAAIRFLIDEGALPVNRQGGAAWRSGEHLWLVSKRVMDAVREHLVSQGHEGIPQSNPRLFDVLAQFGLILPNGDKAVWRVTVDDQRGWTQELSMLKMPLQNIWPNPDQWPDEFSGQISASAPSEGGVNVDSPAREHDAVDETLQDSLMKKTEQPEGDLSNGLKTHASQTPSLSYLDISAEDSKSPKHAAEPQSSEEKCETGNNHQAEPGEEDHAGLAFESWLKTGIATGALSLNNAKAKVHVVQEGVLLISPTIFQMYAREARKEQWDWRYIQKMYQRLGRNQKTPEGENIWRYQVTGGRKKSILKGWLITDPNQIFGAEPPPPPNPHLQLVSVQEAMS